MRVSFKQLLNDKIILTMTLGVIFLTLIHGLFIAVTFKNLPPFVPLYNQAPWGEARLGSKPQIFLPLGITVLMLMSNFVISSYIYKLMPLISRFLGVTGFLVAVLALLLVIRTILIIN